VLVGVNPGGSGTSNSEIRFLVLAKGAPVKVVGEGNADLAAVWETLQASKDGDRLVADFGYRKKKHVIATFDTKTDGVTVDSNAKGAPPKSKGGVSDDDCKWLHDKMLTLCTGVAKPCKNPTQAVLDDSMAISRGYLAVTENPAFKPRKFIKACDEACRSRHVADYEKFQSSVCR
jgi:hypothetical protein